MGFDTRLPYLLAACLLCWCAIGCSAEPDSDTSDDQEEASDDQGEEEEEEDQSGQKDAQAADSAARRDGSSQDSGSDAGKDTGMDTGTGAVADSGRTSTDSGSTQTNPDAAARDSGQSAQPDAGGPELDPFSFFLTSVKAMRELSGNQEGFGGDLRYGETGTGAGLRGADKICSTIAEMSMPGAGSKVWRAFLSAVSAGEDGGAVHAADRIGEGPWYDRAGRLVGMSKTDLLQVRPAMADTLIKNDLPNEDGVPNHDPDGTGQVDNHDILTGTGADGRLYRDDARVTCNDWTKSAGDAADAPRVGHSWPRGSRPGGGGGGGGGFGGQDNWMSALDEAGCAPGVRLIEMGPPNDFDPTVGSGGGYGGIYCFALSP